MNRAAAGTWADTTPMTKNPARAASWFLLGVTIAATMNALRFREAGYDRKSYALNQRVAQNEHTHAILRGISSHLATKKMSVWDANPNWSTWRSHKNQIVLNHNEARECLLLEKFTRSIDWIS